MQALQEILDQSVIWLIAFAVTMALIVLVVCRE
jgi:uncharacterized RDD family membrane protein YckC